MAFLRPGDIPARGALSRAADPRCGTARAQIRAASAPELSQSGSHTPDRTLLARASRVESAHSARQDLGSPTRGSVQVATCRRPMARATAASGLRAPSNFSRTSGRPGCDNIPTRGQTVRQCYRADLQGRRGVAARALGAVARAVARAAAINLCAAVAAPFIAGCSDPDALPGSGRAARRDGSAVEVASSRPRSVSRAREQQPGVAAVPELARGASAGYAD